MLESVDLWPPEVDERGRGIGNCLDYPTNRLDRPGWTQDRSRLHGNHCWIAAVKSLSGPALGLLALREAAPQTFEIDIVGLTGSTLVEQRVVMAGRAAKPV